MKKKLRPYQTTVRTKIYNAWDQGHKNVLAIMPTGAGKCLGEDTPVLMHDGSIKNVQDIEKNDLIMGPDSKPRKVQSTCTGESEMYKIDPIKGEPWYCNDVHVLTLRHTTTKKIIDIPLNEYLEKSNNFKHLHKLHRVGVEYPGKIVRNPYMLGLYLTKKKYSHSRKWGVNTIIRLCKSCTTKDSRWIPDEYLINSRDVRLQVLAGLLDGDGYLHNGYFEIITKYKQLSDDLLYLCRSLGLAAYSSFKIGRIKSTGFEGEYFRVSISGHLDMIPNIVPRKKAPPRRQKKDVCNTGFSVKSVGKNQYYGFTLDGDGRFLLGDFTITHNTVTFSDIAIEHAIERALIEPVAIVVHRKELVQQISLTLAHEDVSHNIIAQRKTIQGIIAGHRKECGKNYYNSTGNITVISVDTLNSRFTVYQQWAKGVKLWITDEATHLLKDNKWGRAVAIFPNAKGLGVTATPERLDKKGLGSHVDGVFDVMIEGPTTKWLINQGNLCKYKVAVPHGDYQDHLKQAGNNTDFTKKAMTEASNKSQIVGDVVVNHKRFANGLQTILFATDVKTAFEMEKKFLEAGIPAKTLTGETNDQERLQAMIDFREKKIRVLINVDLFDEGLDVPGIECVQMARPTMSLGKFLQMIGRGLRPAQGKAFLMLIDHVGNVGRHGLPDKPRQWTLDRIKKRRKVNNLMRVCDNPMCASPYDRELTACPWCGTDAIRKGGGGGGRMPPEQVDGDLFLIDPFTLEEMANDTCLEAPGDIATRVGKAAGPAAAKSALKNQLARIAIQRDLSERIAQWAGEFRSKGYQDREINKKFFIEQGLTINQALAQKSVDMKKLLEEL